MSILNPVPKRELGTVYQQKGWVFGIVPVYIGWSTEQLEDHVYDCPYIAERNWVPEWWFTFGERLFDTYCMITGVDCGEIAMLITGKLK